MALAVPRRDLFATIEDKVRPRIIGGPTIRITPIDQRSFLQIPNEKVELVIGNLYDRNFRFCFLLTFPVDMPLACLS